MNLCIDNYNPAQTFPRYTQVRTCTLVHARARKQITQFTRNVMSLFVIPIIHLMIVK